MTGFPFRFTAGGIIPADVKVGIVLKRDAAPTPEPVAEPAPTPPAEPATFRGWSWSATRLTQDPSDFNVYTVNTADGSKSSGWSGSPPEVNSSSTVNLRVDTDALDAYWIRAQPILTGLDTWPTDEDTDTNPDGIGHGFRFILESDPTFNEPVRALHRTLFEIHERDLVIICGRDNSFGAPPTDTVGLQNGDKLKVTATFAWDADLGEFVPIGWPITFAFGIPP